MSRRDAVYAEGRSRRSGRCQHTNPFRAHLIPSRTRRNAGNSTYWPCARARGNRHSPRMMSNWSLSAKSGAGRLLHARSRTQSRPCGSGSPMNHEAVVKAPSFSASSSRQPRKSDSLASARTFLLEEVVVKIDDRIEAEEAGAHKVSRRSRDIERPSGSVRGPD